MFDVSSENILEGLLRIIKQKIIPGRYDTKILPEYIGSDEFNWKEYADLFGFFIKNKNFDQKIGQS